jgi:hypothetical protein
MYIIVRGGDMGERAARRMARKEEATRSYIRETAGPSTADEMAKLAELHAGGSLSDAEYAQAKQNALA